jgi:hypothetical protein
MAIKVKVKLNEDEFEHRLVVEPSDLGLVLEEKMPRIVNEIYKAVVNELTGPDQDTLLTEKIQELVASKIDDTISEMQEITNSTSDLIDEVNELVEKITEQVTEEALEVLSLINKTGGVSQVLFADSIEELTAPEGTTLLTGAIGIVTSIDDGGIEHKTSYVYSNGTWQAMNGNYTADNIYFNSDIEVTQDIGYIKVDNATGVGSIPAQGKSLSEVFELMFSADAEPTIDLPSATITLSVDGATAASSYEVGTQLTTITYNATFTDGKYSFTTVPPGCSVTSWTIKDPGNQILSSNLGTGSVSGFTVTDDTEFYVTAQAKYTDATTIPKTKKGEERPNLKLLAGTTSKATSNKIKGYRNYYYGPITTTGDITEDLIKTTLTASGKSYIASANITWQAADTENITGYVIAIPKNQITSTRKGLTKVSLDSNSNQDITSAYEKIDEISIKGTGNDTGTPYTVWLYRPAQVGSDEKHTFTLA